VGGWPCGRSRCVNAALDKVLGGWFRTSKNEPLSTHGTHWLIEQKPHRYKLMPEIVGLGWRNYLCVFRVLEGPMRCNEARARRVFAVCAVTVT
jgi:hypothetical protein